MTKIVVCIPLSWMSVPRLFMFNMIHMVQQAQKAKIELVFITHSSCYMDKARDSLVELALELKPHYILWLDADQIYPVDTPEILARHMGGSRLVVGGVTPRKDNGKPMLRRFIELDGENIMMEDYDGPLDKGLIEIDAMGFGGVMTHPKVFAKIPFPRFKMWANSKTYVGEDTEFFRQCKLKGIKVWCDTNLKYEHLVLGFKREG